METVKSKLEEKIDFSFYSAEGAFSKNGSFISMFDVSFTDTKDKSSRAVFAFITKDEDGMQKKKFAYQLGAILGNFTNKGKIKDIEDILMICEGYGSMQTKVAPKDDPDKFEILLSVGQNRKGECFMKGKKINKMLNGDKFEVELEEMEDCKNTQSPLLDTFFNAYDKVVKEKVIFKDEDMPASLVQSLSKLLN